MNPQTSGDASDAERTHKRDDDLRRVREAVETLGRLVAAIEMLQHDLKADMLHRKDSPRPDGTLVTLGEERPHEPWCIPCRLLAIFDPGLDKRATPDRSGLEG